MERQLRLRRTKDFARVRQEGRVYRHPFLILSVAPNELGHNRYGFVTGKRLGKAVARNRARRRFRESVRKLHPMLAPGFDVIVIVRSNAIDQPFVEVQRALADTFRRAGMLDEKMTQQ